MNVFKTFDAILSSSLVSRLKYSQYKKYMPIWRGRDSFTTAKILNERERQAFIDNYIEKAKNSPNFKERFDREFKKNIALDRHYQEKLDYELCTDIEKYIELSFSEGWIPTDKTLEEVMHDEDYAQEVIDYIVDNDLFYLTDFYKEKFDTFAEYDSELKNELIDEAEEILFEKEQNAETITHKVNISKVYEPLFSALIKDNADNTKYRLYYDIDIDANDIVRSVDRNVKPGKYNFNALITVLPYIIERYFYLLNKRESADEVMNQALKPSIFKTNYFSGYYYDPITDRKIRIAKILDFVRTKDPEYSPVGADQDLIKKIFINRPSPFVGKVCISRHPYDIAGMSTDRGWTSCMDLDKGLPQSVAVDWSIIRACLIVYLIRYDDIKIHRPVSRLLLKPYIYGDEIDYESPNWLLKASTTYGTHYDKFEDFAQKWANKYWNSEHKRNSKARYTIQRDLYPEIDDPASISEQHY